MLSKITHFLKYGIIGGIAGTAFKIIGNWENPAIPMKDLLIWTTCGIITGMLVSLVMERWFNAKYRD